MKRYFPSFQNNRGVALLIVLLVTALLIALIFEFAYATRVSLRAAVNFRDSQRAYFLARSAVNVFAKYKDLQDNIPQGEWGVVPIVSEGDTELRIRWEDERGKIYIKGYLSDKDTVAWLTELFRIRGVDQGILTTMQVEYQGKQIQLLTELHQVMSDEDFGKVSGFLTVYSGQKSVNVNTASDDVLKSMGIDPALILAGRPYSTKDNITGIDTVMTAGNQNVKNFLDVTSTVFTVYAYATVGGYTRQIEAVITRGSTTGSTTPRYWRVK